VSEYQNFNKTFILLANIGKKIEKPLSKKSFEMEESIQLNNRALN
jgi:hypothetical protein